MTHDAATDFWCRYPQVANVVSWIILAVICGAGAFVIGMLLFKAGKALWTLVDDPKAFLEGLTEVLFFFLVGAVCYGLFLVVRFLWLSTVVAKGGCG